MKIYLIRHAESMGNISGKFHGQDNVPLSATGEKQARLLGNFFEDKKIDRIYTSKLQRTIQTADFALPGRRGEFISLASLNEIHGGDWEGVTYVELFEKWEDEFGKWRNEPHLAVPPNGETMYDVSERAISTLNDIIEDNDDDSTIAVFAHGALIKTVIIYLRDLPMSELKRVAWYENSSVTELVVENGKCTLGFYNNHDHLPMEIKSVENSDWAKAMKASCLY